MNCECIDYPVSWTFWRAHCWEVHGFDPGPNEATSQGEQDALDEMQATIQRMQVKINQLSRKPRDERAKKTYRSLDLKQ